MPMADYSMVVQRAYIMGMKPVYGGVSANSQSSQIIFSQLQMENLRGSHFELGHMQDNPASIYTRDYPPKKAEFDGSGVGKNPFRSSSLGGLKNEANHFLTTNKIKYQEWKNAQKAQLDEFKAHDLKTHHFCLGNYNNKRGPVTTNQYYHDQKPLSNEAGVNSEQQKQKMRAHHHDFKQQPGTLMSSVYNQEYKKKFAQPNQALQNANGIRETHIVFGKDRNYMLTTNAADYGKKDPVHTTKAQIQTANLILGNNKDSFETTNQIYHGKQPMTKAGLPEETMRELRATHFNLGQTQGGYRTQSNNYQAHPGYRPDKAFNPKLQNSSPLAPNGNFYGTTTNQRELPVRPLSNILSNKPQMHGNNFQLGNQGNSYTTEFSSNYVPKAGERVMPITKPTGGAPEEEGLVIGTDKNNYVTTHRANFTAKDLNAARPDQLRSNFRGHNFTVGNTHENHITVYQDEYRQDQEHKSAMFHKVKL